MSFGQKSSKFCSFFTSDKKNDSEKSVSSNQEKKILTTRKQDTRNEPRLVKNKNC